MAGRGTDILLGGSLDVKIFNAIKDTQDENEIQTITNKIKEEHEDERAQVVAIGGLFVIGSERHESRRIDNQLRGRSGRLGDPGESQFYLSLKDDLLRIFGGERIDRILEKLGFKGGEAINHPMLNSVIARSQKKLEDHNYDIRKNVLKYDDIMNDQRNFVYRQRNFLLNSEDFADLLNEMLTDINTRLVNECYLDNGEKLDTNLLQQNLHETYGDVLGNKAYDAVNNLPAKISSNMIDEINVVFNTLHDKKFIKYSPELKLGIEKRVFITILDECWKDHLYQLGNIREVIHLRAYAQKDPLTEYKIDAFKSFENMLHRFHSESLRRLSILEIIPDNVPQSMIQS
jgi:preprotein translocase subunit SecA